MLPHHFTCDHTHLWEFSKVKQEFLEQLYFWPLELINTGGSFSHFDLNLNSWDECMLSLDPSTYLIEGSDMVEVTMIIAFNLN